MTCAEIEELAGAIALGAVPAEEWPAVREHLATCERGHEEVRRLAAVATLLLDAAPPVEPPARLRGRILAAARAEAAAPDAPPADASSGERSAPPARIVRRGDRSWWQRPAWGAAAAALLLAAGMGAWNITLRRDLERTEQRLATEERAVALLAGEGRRVDLTARLPGAGGTVLRGESGPAVLVVHGLPRTPDRTYQVWAIRGDQPISIGLFEPDESGRQVVTLDHDLRNVDAVAITLEPSPRGSRLPTTEPVMQASVQGAIVPGGTRRLIAGDR